MALIVPCAIAPFLEFAGKLDFPTSSTPTEKQHPTNKRAGKKMVAQIGEGIEMKSQSQWRSEVNDCLVSKPSRTFIDTVARPIDSCYRSIAGIKNSDLCSGMSTRNLGSKLDRRKSPRKL